MFRHVRIGDNERGILLRDGRCLETLDPGEYWLLGSGVEFVLVDAEKETGRGLCNAAGCTK